MQAIEKIKSINKESITSANNNIFTWNAHGDRYLAKKDRIDYSTLFLIHELDDMNVMTLMLFCPFPFLSL